MLYLWSALYNAFFPAPLRKDYESAGWDLNDAVKVDTAVFTEFSASRIGKVRITGVDKMPAWADIPPPTQQELITAAVAKIQAFISDANVVIAPLKDALDGGYIDDADKPTLIAWQKYRYALTKVDPANPVWPVKPE